VGEKYFAELENAKQLFGNHSTIEQHKLFICVNDFIPPTSITMITLYENYKDNDGFLYINYLLENTFG
jgi:hypothetical protein